MNRLVCAAAVAALSLYATPSRAEETLTPPAGYVLVPAPPPGYALEAVPVERSWVVGASVGKAFPGNTHGTGPGSGRSEILGTYADFFLAPRLSMGLFADRMSLFAFGVSTTVDVTALGIRLSRHFFGGARSAHLRGGLGLSRDVASGGGGEGIGLRAFLGYVVPVGDRAALFAQATYLASRSSGEFAIGSLAVGLELGN